jgi:hypothetical protein
MKRIIAFAIVLVAVLSLTACTDNDFVDTDGISLEFVYTMADEMLFGDVTALVEHVDHVFVGEVESISFAVINDVTGRIPTENCNPDFLTLITIYDVTVLFSYMGAQQTAMRVVVPGGVRGYREDEQLSAVLEAGALAFSVDGIYRVPVHIYASFLEIGGVYLFAVLDLDIEMDGYSNFVGRVNSLQSFFDLNDPFDKSMDNFSNITIESLIGEFGEVAFEEFMQNMQYINRYRYSV